MALTFSASVTNLMANGAIQSNLGGVSVSNHNTASSVTIYSGVQPTAENILANWSSYNSTNTTCLIHYTPVIWQLATGNASAVVITNSTATAPINSGTASWAILWSTMQVTTSQLASGTIPTASFFVAPVSDITGTGIIRFTSTVLTSGTPVNIVDAGILTNFNILG